jgi:hypothetical protein
MEAYAFEKKQNKIKQTHEMETCTDSWVKPGPLQVFLNCSFVENNALKAKLTTMQLVNVSTGGIADMAGF